MAWYQAIAWTNDDFCQLISQEQTSVKYGSKWEDFHSRKCIWKCGQQNCGHFVSVPVCVKKSFDSIACCYTQYYANVMQLLLM